MLLSHVRVTHILILLIDKRRTWQKFFNHSISILSNIFIKDCLGLRRHLPHHRKLVVSVINHVFNHLHGVVSYDLLFLSVVHHPVTGVGLAPSLFVECHRDSPAHEVGSCLCQNSEASFLGYFRNNVLVNHNSPPDQLIPINFIHISKSECFTVVERYSENTSSSRLHCEALGLVTELVKAAEFVAAGCHGVRRLARRSLYRRQLRTLITLLPVPAFPSKVVPAGNLNSERVSRHSVSQTSFNPRSSPFSSHVLSSRHVQTLRILGPMAESFLRNVNSTLIQLVAKVRTSRPRAFHDH
mmetsp:Transcript_15482/g.21758  ORF Transcript_15482/g.21758 Transcript_15482/m.21758 type:complete len:298 (+) Transcript_15482:609-1502(+)